VTAHNDCRVSPFGHPRIKARLTTPRGLSRPPTSFIGSWYQGIHRAPLKTWPQMLASTVQFSNNDQPPTTPPQPASSLGSAPKTQPSGHALRHPTACPTPSPLQLAFHAEAVLTTRAGQECRIVNVPPMSNQHQTFADELASDQPKPMRSAP
jgi:hypothetical protein